MSRKPSKENGANTEPTGQRGQVLVLAALMMVPILLFLGIAVDVGLLFSQKARLQRAVDAAALSGAQSISSTTTAELRAKQVFSSNTMGYSPAVVPVVTSDGTKQQVTVGATQQVPTAFMRIIPALATVPLSASALAVLDSYAEIPLAPAAGLGGANVLGKIGQVMPSTFGPDAHQDLGDAYTPTRSDNPWRGTLPYGYLFRINVPANYITTTGQSKVRVELFDPDSWNHDIYSGDPDDGGSRHNARLVLNGIENGYHKFYRLDEIRGPNKEESYNESWGTTTAYRLYHFRTDLVNLNPFADPNTISTGGGPFATASYGVSNQETDLKWVLPNSNWDIDLNNSSWTRDPLDNRWSFYLYVQATDGSSENGFSFRAGPPGQIEEDNVNDQKNYTWNTGGVEIFSRRAYPMNNAVQADFYVNLTQVPAEAAGVTLVARHYDNDAAGTVVKYYLQAIDGSLREVAFGFLSGGATWGTDDLIRIPAKDDASFSTFFDASHKSAWLKANYIANIAQDTSVWELLYLRPRLLK